MQKRQISFYLSTAYLIAFSLLMQQHNFALPSAVASWDVVVSKDGRANEETNAPGPSDSRLGEADTGVLRQQAQATALIDLLEKYRKQSRFGSYALRGVIIIADAATDSRHANVEDRTKGNTNTYSLDAVLPDNSRLVDIQRNHIVLQKDGVRMRIYLHNLSAEQLAEEKAYLEGANDGYRQIGINEYVVNPYRLSQASTDILLDFSLMMADTDGEMEGIRISGVSPSGLAGKLGLMDNDVLLAVNQEPANSLQNVLRIGVNAHKSDELQLMLRRGNRMIPLTYHLFWEGESPWTPADLLSSGPIFSLLRSMLANSVF
jgi:type II secretory pathway component PulC